MSFQRQNQELQIKLAELQMENEDLVARLTMAFAVEFAAVVGLSSIYFTQEAIPILKIAIMISNWAIVLVAMPLTFQMYEKRRRKLKERIEKLKKEYLW